VQGILCSPFRAILKRRKELVGDDGGGEGCWCREYVSFLDHAETAVLVGFMQGRFS
jgi:hypothetical protein